MADADIHGPVENEQQFWHELCCILGNPCATHELIDDALRSWLSLVSTSRDRFLKDEEDIAACSHRLLDSDVFARNQDYVRTQIIYSLLQEDEAAPLHVIANLLLLDGRSDEAVFKRMNDEGCFARLIELIGGHGDSDRRLHRLLLALIYEISRIDRVRDGDLLHVDDALVIYLFQIIESISDDVDDPYHYPIIRVLLVLNEQYMVAATTAAIEPTVPAAPLTNRVIKILSLQGPQFRTFGENIILLLNRETETSLQLLILKLLYLLFTTKATYEYFYTNDLRVLLDVIIRNLLDLPNDSMSLRHTYLRVLYPLLAHTQLSRPPHYKRDEILKVLNILGGSGNVHFAPADETTLRLVERVSNVKWLSEPENADLSRQFLGISLSHAESASSVSVVDVAVVTEKPGVKTPSRKAEFAPELKDPEPEEHSPVEIALSVAPETQSAAATSDRPHTEAKPKRVLPAVPKHRHGVPTTLLFNGSHHHKKAPPKAPPPRRATRLKPSASTSNLQTTVGTSTVS